MDTCYQTTEFERDGFRVTVKRHYDYDLDLSYLGKYSDKWEEGAIDRAQGEDSWDRREYRYFIPASSPRELQESRKWYTRAGYSKHEAYTLAQAQRFSEYKIMEEYNNNQRGAIGVTASVKYEGREMGRAGVWGIDIESDSDPYIIDAEWEVLNEAVGDAIKFLREDLGASGPEQKLERLSMLLERLERWSNPRERIVKGRTFTDWKAKIAAWRKGMVKDGIFGVYVYPSEAITKPNGRKRSSFYFLGKRFGILQ